MGQQEKDEAKGLFENICLDDYFLENKTVPLKYTLLWNRFSEERTHHCCCCCCEKHEVKDSAEVSIKWKNNVIARSLATGGRTIIVQAWLSWTASAPAGHSVTIQTRIRDANGSTILNWSDAQTDQSLNDNIWCEVGRVNSFYNSRRYHWDFRARVLDQSGSIVAESPLNPLQARVDPTPSVPNC